MLKTMLWPSIAPSVSPMNAHQFQFLARQFRAGKVSLNDFTEQIFTARVLDSERARTENLDARKEPEAVNLDLDRAARCGYPEVIFGEGKTIDEISGAVSRLIQHQQNALVTRLDPTAAQQLQSAFADGIWNERAKTFRVNRFGSDKLQAKKIAVVTAGTADRPVAEEALETLAWMNLHSACTVFDAGVAGPQRLTSNLDQLKTCGVAIVIAGADGVLPSVAAGHLDCPVIAVPTSVGYGGES